MDRELYLPKSWTEDSDRCRTARIPESKSFATKPELARAMVRRALDSALPIAWVTADAAYGQEWHFRRMLEEAGVGYVLAVPKSQQVKSPAGSWRIDHVLTGAPAEAWERISCGDGAKGPRVYDWAAVKLPTIEGSDPSHYRWVPARRSLARPEEIAYYLAFARRTLPSPNWFGWPAPGGPSRSASRPRRTSAVWTSTKSAATSAGIATSPWPCSRTPSWRQ
ncbi:transposase [Streptomyces sp. NPDC005498]|uniref:IS701 family transposase n=1 Tax=Streptomyces sp. NPDC005498 TaxID=3364717 RepID=UPI0036C8C638